MKHGRVAMDGSPERIFTRVEDMRRLGLTVPETTELIWDLNKKGFHLPLNALTVEDCADAIYKELQQ
jgi:energy-coupling factor transport system ATP-binding protein